MQQIGVLYENQTLHNQEQHECLYLMTLPILMITDCLAVLLTLWSCETTVALYDFTRSKMASKFVILHDNSIIFRRLIAVQVRL